MLSTSTPTFVMPLVRSFLLFFITLCIWIMHQVPFIFHVSSNNMIYYLNFRTYLYQILKLILIFSQFVTCAKAVVFSFIKNFIMSKYYGYYILFLQAILPQSVSSNFVLSDIFRYIAKFDFMRMDRLNLATSPISKNQLHHMKHSLHNFCLKSFFII